MKHSTAWRGIFVIAVTPFDEHLALDEASLRRGIEYCIEAGAQGVVGPANASEFATLSDAEKMRWIQVVQETAGDHIPFVAATSGLHARGAVEFSTWAAAQGVAGLMAMPPYVLHPDAAGCHAYYRQLAQAVSIPIILQNFMGPVGTPMTPELVGRICRELEWVRYVKEETLPEPRQISATRAATGDSCLGVFGGMGGVYLLDEFRRGACGNMPACQIAHQHVELWRLLEEGHAAKARTLFNRILPLISFERMHGVAAYKEVMRRRGLFATARSRMPNAYLDPMDLAELDAILDGIEPSLVT